MKKYLLIILLTLMFVSPVLADDGFAFDSAVQPEDLEGEHFFKSPLNYNMMMPEITGDFDYDYGLDHSKSYKPLKEGQMPLFKQFRLGITNKLRKLVPPDKEVVDNEEEETELDYYDLLEKRDSDQQKVSKFSKFKFWKKKNSTATDSENSNISTEEGAIANSIQSETMAPADGTISFETGISEHVTEKELMLDAENVNYNEETGDMIATGRPLLYIPPQNTKVVADTMIYNQDSNIIKGIGNVVVTRDGVPTKSNYIEIDMNEESMYMDQVESQTNLMIVDAEKAEQKNDLLILTNGNFHSDISRVYKMSSKLVGPKFRNMIIDDDERSFFLTNPEGNKIQMDVEKIYVNAGKNHDKYVLKNIKINRKGKHWFTWPSLTAYTNKDRDYFEANYPELGTRRKLGMYIGPGFTFGGPGGSVIKAIPFLNYQHGDFGFGGALRYRNTFNETELGYGSAADIFFLRGHQRLDDDLYLQYSANSFMDEWFLGSRMPKYMAEVYFDKKYGIPNFLAEGKGLSFRHRAGFGLMEDNDRNYYGEKIRSNGTTTTRLRYMAQISQTLYSYENLEKQFHFNFSWVLQGSAAVYGTGDTQFIGRTGPRAHIQYKNWMQDMAYYQSGYDDKTPIPRYDRYRYGHSSFYLAEIFRLNRYISVGWSGMVNLSDDAPNGKLFQENRFVVAFGPDDLKIRLGYDFVRRSTYFGFDVAFDTKGTNINYKRMEIKNPERLGQHEKAQERKISFSPVKAAQEEEKLTLLKKKNAMKDNSKPKVLNYAKVIDIEDPDKETVD